jgi:hypothetical protein
MERRKFTREFKLEAVRLIKQRGVSYAQRCLTSGSSLGDSPELSALTCTISFGHGPRVA